MTRFTFSCYSTEYSTIGIDDVTLDDARSQLTAGKGSLRCAEVRSILTGLGFVVRERKKQGHFTYNHPAISEFHGSSFACPHKSGDSVLKSYITKILSVIKKYEHELMRHIGGQND